MKFSIERKMVLGFLPLMLVICVIAILSARTFNELDSINRSIINEDVFLVQAAREMEDAILAQESFGRRYLILGSQQMLDLFRQRSREFDEIADKVRALPQQKNIPIEQLTSLHNEFNILYTNADGPGPDHSLQFSEDFDDQAMAKFEEIMAYLQQMRLVGQQNQYLKMEQANSIGIQSFRLAALLSALGIILGLAAASLITRSISRSITKLKRATEIIAEGRYDHFPQMETTDELGELAGSIGSMARRLSQLEETYRDSNPLTRMPGGAAVENTLIKRLATDKAMTFCLLDLDNFKSYNDRYGYANGNEVIRATALIIQSVVAEQGCKEDFVGHIGGDDFVIITDNSHFALICKTIISRFDENIVNFYNETDRANGQIIAKSRQGQEIIIPLMSISIAVVATEQNGEMNHIRVGEIAAELKEYAKSIPGSVYVTNRRGQKPETYPARKAFRVIK
jgi:diguanylate cyclase (GGDEF)-like protein